jgi:hypothetical protein
VTAPEYNLHKLRLLESCAWLVADNCGEQSNTSDEYRQACLDALLDVLNERNADGTPW